MLYEVEKVDVVFAKKLRDEVDLLFLQIRSFRVYDTIVIMVEQVDYIWVIKLLVVLNLYLHLFFVSF